MSLGNVYHCTLITVLGLYCLDLFDPIGTARGDLLYPYYYYYYYCIWAHSARSTGFRLDLYPILHLDFILGLFRMLA